MDTQLRAVEVVGKLTNAHASIPAGHVTSVLGSLRLLPPSFLADQAFRRNKTEAHVHVYIR